MINRVVVSALVAFGILFTLGSAEAIEEKDITQTINNCIGLGLTLCCLYKETNK